MSSSDVALKYPVIHEWYNKYMQEKCLEPTAQNLRSWTKKHGVQLSYGNVSKYLKGAGKNNSARDNKFSEPKTISTKDSGWNVKDDFNDKTVLSIKDRMSNITKQKTNNENNKLKIKEEFKNVNVSKSSNSMININIEKTSNTHKRNNSWNVKNDFKNTNILSLEDRIKGIKQQQQQQNTIINQHKFNKFTKVSVSELSKTVKTQNKIVKSSWDIENDFKDSKKSISERINNISKQSNDKNKQKSNEFNQLTKDELKNVNVNICRSSIIGIKNELNNTNIEPKPKKIKLNEEFENKNISSIKDRVNMMKEQQLNNNTQPIKSKINIKNEFEGIKKTKKNVNVDMSNVSNESHKSSLKKENDFNNFSISVRSRTNTITEQLNKIRKKQKESKEFVSNICDIDDSDYFDYCDNLNHKSNKFIETDVDLENTNELHNALTIVSERAFSTSFKEVSNNISQKQGFGKHKILLPNGDIKTHDLNGDKLIGAQVTFYKNKNENENNINNNSDNDEKEDTFETYVYYDANCFGPSIQIDKTNNNIMNELINNNTNNTIDILSNSELNIDDNFNTKTLEYLKLFHESANNLTKNYLSNINETSNLHKNIAKILYNRETIIPELILKELNVENAIETTTPQESCRAFFTGAVVAGEYKYEEHSKVYEIDDCSEYVGQGNYPDNSLAFPKAVATTFDGIAIDKNTRVIIYEKKNFEGKILWDKKGPAIINNCIWKDRYSSVNTDIYNDNQLQNNFPCNVREWSESNMHQWSYGSLKVISNKFQ